MSCELDENPVFVIMHLKCDGIVGTKDEDKDSKTAEIWRGQTDMDQLPCRSVSGRGVICFFLICKRDLMYNWVFLSWTHRDTRRQTPPGWVWVV